MHVCTRVVENLADHGNVSTNAADRRPPTDCCPLAVRDRHRPQNRVHGRDTGVRRRTFSDLESANCVLESDGGRHECVARPHPGVGHRRDPRGLCLSDDEQPLRAAGRVVPAARRGRPDQPRAVLQVVRRQSWIAVAPVARVRSRLRRPARRGGVRAVRCGRPPAPGARCTLDHRLGSPPGPPGFATHLSRPHRGRRAQLGRGDHRRPDPAPQTRLPGLHLARRPWSRPALAPAFPGRPQTARTRPQQATEKDRQHRAHAAARTARTHPVQRHLRRDLALLRNDVARGGRPVEPRKGAADDRAADRGTQPTHPRRDRLPGAAGLPASSCWGLRGPTRS